MYYILVDIQHRSIRSASERRTRFTALINQNAYIERPIPSLVEEETALPSSVRGDTQTLVVR
jgi:hypothetical protein